VSIIDYYKYLGIIDWIQGRGQGLFPHSGPEKGYLHEKIVYSSTRSESKPVAKFAVRGKAECSNCNEGIFYFPDLVGEDIFYNTCTENNTFPNSKPC